MITKSVALEEKSQKMGNLSCGQFFCPRLTSLYCQVFNFTVCDQCCFIHTDTEILSFKKINHFSLAENSGHFTWARLQQPHEQRYPYLTVCAVRFFFFFFLCPNEGKAANPWDYTDLNACGSCTPRSVSIPSYRRINTFLHTILSIGHYPSKQPTAH